MIDLQTEIEDYVEKFRAADPDRQSLLRAKAYLYLRKWEEIKNQIRAIDMEAD